VFDWGGGTLDVTILRSVNGIFMEQASKGLPTKGGIDFDTRVRKLLLQTIPDTATRRWTPAERRRFDLDVELAKIKLSSQDFTIVQLPGGDSRRLTRAMFDDAVRSLIEESRRPIQQCLDDIAVGAGAIDSVIMVGGTSSVPAVRGFVAELLGREPEAGIDPMTAVGEGAAIAAAILTGELDDNDFFVATEHALGTVTFDPVAGAPSFSVLIPRNHKLPARRTETYTPLHADQESATIAVIEGDPHEPVEHPDNVVLKEWTVALPGERGSSTRTFDMTYEYDVDGILHVTVTDNSTGATMLEDDVSYGITDDKRELVRMARRARDVIATGLVESGDGARKETVRDVDPEGVKLLQQAHVKVIPFLDDDEADEVRAAARALELAAPDDVEACKVHLREILAPYSYLF
jgi:molecular chaperone DnaK